MALIRVFLLTCRRPALLRRALDSLRAQTFTDWICELHNDAPEDDTPRHLLAEIADPRITLHHHPSNWGALASFNHACSGPAEPFFSILEDDNWWEPSLLSRLVDALHAYPSASTAWANLRFWRENPDGTWTDEQRTLWPVLDAPVVPIALPQLIQFDGPLHSNGAMLVRSSIAHQKRLVLPAEVPFASMENLRERYMPGPLLLVPEPLAHFALTCTTARQHDRAHWARQQALLGAAFIQQLKPPDSALRHLWHARRVNSPRATSGLVLAGLLARDWRFLAHASPGDWFAFAAGFFRRPYVGLAALRARATHPALAAQFTLASEALAKHTAPEIPGQIAPFTLATPSDLNPAWVAAHPIP